MSNLPTIDVLRTIVSYDPETGDLTWLPRTASMFSGGRQSPEHSCKIWNSANAGRPALSAVNKNGYRHGAIFGKTISAHRVCWALAHGRWPDQTVDHINGDRLDNRLVNLRDVPIAENSKNQRRKKKNSSGITGVYFFARTRKWVASIKGDGKVRNLGYFDTIEAAAIARKAAERRYGFHVNHGRAA